MNSDFYNILNISKNATHEEIKKSYRKLVLKYHPDKNSDPQSVEIFRKIQIAYETLSDNTKRAKYDSLDLMNNSTDLKNIFLYYQELVNEMCENYDLTDNDRQEILNLFDPNNFQKELNNNDIDAAYKKLSDDLWMYVRQFMVKKISVNHPYMATAFNYLLGWLF